MNPSSTKRGLQRRLELTRITALTSCLLGMLLPSAGAVDEGAVARELSNFKAWLEREHPGYGCDEGPAAFQNQTVEAAYGGRRFYYVLTYTRGIPPPFKNSLSMVVQVSEDAEVRPVDSSSPASLQPGLMRVTSVSSAQRAAAAVLILAMGDPGERRWRFTESLISIRKTRKGWVCRYQHGDESHTSQVTFDKSGKLSGIQCNPPPVP